MIGTCGTCGREIKKKYRRWLDERGISYCRIIMIDGILHEADYHHNEGEPQEIWRLSGPPPYLPRMVAADG